MKITAVHTDFRIYWPARLNALSEALEKRGDSLEVIEIAGKGSNYAFAENNVNNNLKWHILFPDKSPEELAGKNIEPRLFNLLSKIQPDVIIAGAIAFPSGALAVRWGQINNTKVIIFDDSKIEAVNRSPLVNFIKQSVYNGVDALFLPAEDWITTGKYWNFEEQRLFFGVDVVDNEFWAQPSHEVPDFKDYFLAVGRQISAKNFYGVIKAYADYCKQTSPENTFHFVMIGDGPERELIEDHIKDTGIQDKVHLLPFMNQKTLIGFYQQAAAICIASKSETWGLVINEAMAAGCPVFASNQCGATNVLVKHGINGYSFDCDNLKDLTEAMVRFSSLSTEKQKSMGEASKRIISDWGLNKFSDGAVSAIDYVVKSKKRKANILERLIISKWKGQYRPV